MKSLALLVTIGLAGSAFVVPRHSPDGVFQDGEGPAPYIAYLTSLEESEATPLTDALSKLPGVEEIEAFAGKKRSVHLHTKDGYYLARAQVEAVVTDQDLALDSFEVPEWARLRLYVVEASGGG